MSKCPCYVVSSLVAISVAAFAACGGSGGDRDPEDVEADGGASECGAGVDCSCLVDTDLDGLADCDDPEPQDPYSDTVSHGVGSAAPLEAKARLFAAGGWDGRLFIGLRNENVDGELVITYTAELFRPEAVASDDRGRPLLEAEGVFAPRKVFAGDDPRHGFHVTICPEPGVAENPYRSLADGTPSVEGAFETYRLGIVGTLSDDVGNYLAATRGRVVVDNPRTPEATIAAAQILAPLTPLQGPGGVRLNRYEPSITPDCRLLVWHGRVDNDPNALSGVAVYSYNDTPLGTTGWSQPRSITDMHYVHGPGAAEETDVAGVPFSERYPVAREPMRDYDGRVFEPGEYMFGPYPWVSLDASEIFFPTIITFSGPARSAYSVVGARTGYALRHIDGAINPSRSDLLADDATVAFEGTEQGTLLVSAYDDHRLGDGRALGPNGYQRLFVFPIALSQSMWSPFLADERPLLPEARHQGVYAFFLSHSRRYVEVDLGQQEDGHFLLYLPMNEHVTVDHDDKQRLVDLEVTGGAFWGVRRVATGWDTSRTPDVSGHLQHATLSDGARFPYEQHGALATWQSFYDAWQIDPSLESTGDAVAGDRIDGIVGNAIYFSAGASVRASLAPKVVERMRSSNSATISLWTKPLADGSYALAEQPGAFSLSRESGRILVTFGSGSATTELSGAAGAVDAWQHIAVTFGAHGAELYLDGVRSAATAESISLSGADASVTLGPTGAGSGGDPLYLLDEVSLSDVRRTRSEIERFALVARTFRDDLDDWPTALPLGLEKAQPRLFRNQGAPSPELITLGSQLFFGNMLSRNNNLSCASCHVPALAFTDGKVVGEGLGPLTRNSSYIGNRLFSTRQFLDGRAPSLEAQVLVPIAAAKELGFSTAGALERIEGMPELRSQFELALGLGSDEPIEPAHLAAALASFVRSLLSGNSPHDRDELSAAERRGRALFFGVARCAGCHHGPNFTDEEFHAIGFDLAEPGNVGRGEVTGRQSDRGRFKTPSLRDIALTAPYFHDGSAATLREVLDFYNRGGDSGENRDLAIQPLGLTTEQQDDLEAFLGALTGTTLPTE